MSRVHKRWLGVSSKSEKPKAELIERVTFTAGAVAAIREQLEVSGVFRGGLLFGKVEDGTLRVNWVARGGYPMWTTSPLQVDSHYALGWADALNTVDVEADWVGHWLVYATSNMYSQFEDAMWVHTAYEAGLVSEQQVFVIFGWENGQLVVKPYVMRGEATPLEVELEKPVRTD